MEQDRVLIIIDNGFARQIRLDRGEGQWRLGRQNSGTFPDIPLSSAFVSKEHGIFRLVQGVWTYENNPENRFGTWYNSEPLGRAAEEGRGGMGQRTLRDGDALTIRAGKETVMLLYREHPLEGKWTAFRTEGSEERIYVGSNPDYCSICLPLPRVSARNTVFVREADRRWYVEDLGSLVGTWVNGKKAEGREYLHNGSRIHIDKCLMIYLDGILYYNEAGSEDAALERDRLNSERIILSAKIHSKKVNDKRSRGLLESIKNLVVPVKKELLHDVSLDIREGTLVALLGTAGAGKSTVMNCLNGMELGGVTGSILYDGVDLKKHFSRVQYQIGSVPQQKVVHPSLTVREELTEAAVLRLPAGTGREEIRRRVDDTINVLGLKNVENSRVVKLSGGEMGRVNVGIELVADRKLLCLDEPDAGLSPNLKKELFILLRNLAHDKKVTILAIIHDVSEIYMFDQMIMMVKVDNVGRLAFSGTPREAKARFHTDIKNIYEILEAEPEKYIL